MSSFRLQSGGVFALALMTLVSMGCDARDERADVGGMTDGERLAVAKGAGADAALISEVERKLGSDQKTSAAEIDVTVNMGVVTLSGKVADPAQKQRAEELAKDVEGVERVDNQLVIASLPLGSQELT